MSYRLALILLFVIVEVGVSFQTTERLDPLSIMGGIEQP